jgi:hypothetical protein
MNLLRAAACAPTRHATVAGSAPHHSEPQMLQAGASPIWIMSPSALTGSSSWELTANWCDQGHSQPPVCSGLCAKSQRGPFPLKSPPHRTSSGSWVLFRSASLPTLNLRANLHSLSGQQHQPRCHNGERRVCEPILESVSRRACRPSSAAMAPALGHHTRRAKPLMARGRSGSECLR